MSVTNEAICDVLQLCDLYITLQERLSTHLREGNFQIALSRRSTSTQVGSAFTSSIENARLEVDPMLMAKIDEDEERNPISLLKDNNINANDVVSTVTGMGLPPKAIRMAQREFVSAVSIIVDMANVKHQIEKKLLNK